MKRDAKATPLQCNAEGCSKAGDLQCARCKVKYCGKECQKKDWSAGHKRVCGGSPSSEATMPPKAPILIERKSQADRILAAIAKQASVR